MSETTLSIKLTTEGGKVIVKDFTDISDAAKGAGRALDNTDAASTKASKSIKKTGTSAKGAATDIDKASRSVNTMANQLKLLVGAVSFTLLSKEIKDYADTWKLANNQLSLVSDTERELIAVRKELLDVALDTNTGLLGTIELYASFERGTRALGLSTESVIDITETMNNLLLAGGKSAQETSGAIRQLNQGLESGALRGDEFNSVAEGAPRVLDALAISLGMSRGALRDFAATGGITAEILATALLDYQGTAQGMADATERTFDQQLNNATTNIIEFVGQSTLLNSAVSSTGSGLVLLTENIEALTYGAGAAGAVYAASYIPAIASSITMQYQAAIAAQQSTVAQVAKAKAFLASTVSATNAAKSEAALAAANVAGIQSVIGQLEAEAALETLRLKAQITDQGRIMTASRMAEIQLARTAIVKQLTAAEANLSLAGQRATAMSGIQATTTAGLATAQAAATRTSYALGVATRFLLGPYGLLLAAVGAATAAFYLSAEASDADEKAKTKQAEANEHLLKTFDAMRTNRPSKYTETYLETQQAQIEIDTKLIGLKEKLNALTQATQFAPGANIGKISALKKEIYDLTSAQLNNQRSLDAMKLAYDKGLPSIKSMVEPTKEVVQFTNDVSEELNGLIDTLEPAGAALRQYGEDYDLLLASYVDGFITYEQHIALIELLDTAFAKQSKKTEDATDKNALYVASLEAQLSIGRLIGQELAVETALRKLNADATELQREAVEKLAIELYKQNAATEALDLSDLTSQVDDYGNAWGNVGNTIVDAFGSIGAQLDQFAEQQDSYAQSLEDFAARRALINSSDDISSDAKASKLKELASLEDKLTQQNVQNQLGAFGSIFGGASELFDKQSKAREALNKAEQIFTAIEIGLALQKAAANALTAITTQGQGDPYSAFARIAAMAALMAGLGVFAGSTSGGSIPTAQQNQDSQGTGSVLGDDEAKSSSITASAERFEDIAIDQLFELRGIHDTMRDLNAGIEQLAQSLVGGLDFNGGSYDGKLGTSNFDPGTLGVAVLTGVGGLLIDKLTGGLISGIIGGISSKKKELVDSGISFATQTLGDIFESGAIEASVFNTIETTKKKLWGLVKSSSTDIEYSPLDLAVREQIGAIYNHVGDSVIEAAKLLGFETVELTTSTFINNFDDYDFEDIRNGTFNWGQRFGQLVTTTTSMSLEDALGDFQISLPQISFTDLSGEEIQAELEAVFSQQADLIAEYLVPAISEYQQIGEGAYETLLRVAQEQAVFNDHLDRMGIILSGLSNIELIDVSQNIIDLVGGLDAFQDASNNFFSAFFSDIEQFEYLQQSLNDVLGTMNLALPESRDGFRDLVESVDVTTEEGQRLFATLLQISGSAAEYYDALEDGILVTDAVTESIAARIGIEKSWAEQIVALGLDATQTQLRSLEQWYEEQLSIADEAGASTVLLERLYTTKRTAIIDDAMQTINDNTSSALDALTSEHSAAVSSLTSDYQSLFDAIRSASSAISDGILSIRRTQSGFSEVDYQSGQITSLQGQLGQGDISTQTNTVESLLEATLARFNAQIIDAQYQVDALNAAENERYSAEMDHYNDLVNAANSKYQSELAQYESLKKAADNLKATADSLLIGDLSYLSASDQRTEAQSQYDSLLGRAQAGDADAASELNNFSKQFLEINKDYLGGTGSTEFGALFDQVQSDLRGFNVGAAPSQLSLPAAPREVVQYQNDNLALQEDAISELSSLQLLLDDLNAQAIVEQTAGLDSLKLAFDQSVSDIWALESEKIAALEASAALNTQTEINAIYDASLAIVDAVNAIDVTPVVISPPAPVVTNTSKTPSITPETYPNFTNLEASTKEQTAVIERLHDELKKQSDSQKKQQAALDKLGREFVKVTDTTYQNRRQA
jgi:tape measure domain-containing protein